MSRLPVSGSQLVCLGVLAVGYLIMAGSAVLFSVIGVRRRLGTYQR